MSPEAFQRVQEKRLLIITKANSRSTVHRAAFLDYIGLKVFDANGVVVGERRFLGLFSSGAYQTSVRDLPVIRRKVAEVQTRSGLSPRGHSGKNLMSILEEYPRDRVALNDLGRLLFLQRQYQPAIDMLTRVLQIDPEDLQAHYNLMLCYQGLGKAPQVERERTLYVRFKADEASQAITGSYRRLHPEDNNERQPIHEHLSALPASGHAPPVKFAGRKSLPASSGGGR